ncbi:hypothetical protein GGI42DRAFT_129807 [Trichoderma sp. SZMC 28013]
MLGWCICLCLSPCRGQVLSRKSASLCKGSSQCFFSLLFQCFPCVTAASSSHKHDAMRASIEAISSNCFVQRAVYVLIVSSIGCLHATPAGLLLAHDGGLSMM